MGRPVIGICTALERRRQDLRAAMAGAVDDGCRGLDCEQVVLDGDAVPELAAASSGVDILVCGSRAQGPLGSVVLGSVSRPLLDRTACPLLIVPRGREQRLEDMVTPHSMPTG